MEHDKRYQGNSSEPERPDQAGEQAEVQEHKHPIWNLGTPTELTIAAGVITRTRSNHTVDTQGDDATDDLDTINGGVEGDILLLRAA